MTECQVVVIGGGPSGLSAAIEAAKRGAQVLLIDENSKAGGQLFKQIHKFFGSSAHYSGLRGIDIGEMLLQEAEDAGVKLWLNSAVIGLFKERKIGVERQNDYSSRKTEIIEAEKIVIATGASENAISFKGWTLPGVMGAGAAQTMINIHRVLPGKRILMVGSGNVGLIVSYQLLQAGAEVVAILEAAGKIGGYGVHATKIRRAAVPIYTSHTILEARGEKEVEEAVIYRLDGNFQPITGSEERLKVDTVTIAAGLRPLIELARMHDCECYFVPQLGGWLPVHDENMESSYPGIYVAGDTAGIEEASSAIEEGRLAGVAIAESLGLIASKEAKEIKHEIWKRLSELRMGPFGEQRMIAKKLITEKRKR